VRKGQNIPCLQPSQDVSYLLLFPYTHTRQNSGLDIADEDLTVRPSQTLLSDMAAEPREEDLGENLSLENLHIS
jgi:hypothetical protein